MRKVNWLGLYSVIAVVIMATVPVAIFELIPWLAAGMPMSERDWMTAVIFGCAAPVFVPAITFMLWELYRSAPDIFARNDDPEGDP